VRQLNVITERPQQFVHPRHSTAKVRAQRVTEFFDLASEWFDTLVVLTIPLLDQLQPRLGVAEGMAGLLDGGLLDLRGLEQAGKLGGEKFLLTLFEFPVPRANLVLRGAICAGRRRRIGSEIEPDVYGRTSA